MSIEVDRLSNVDGWEACERLGLELLGGRPSPSLCRVQILRAIHDSGGLVLGAWDTSGVERVLVGALADLAGTFRGFPSFFSLFAAVLPRRRNAGIGLALRSIERAEALAVGVEVIRGWVDPLRSDESHVSLNRLGAVGVGYARNVFGELNDRPNVGLATDRVAIEWWIRSPRTEAALDRGRLMPHARLGLHQMAVITKTSPGPAGERTLVEVLGSVTGSLLLVEVPEYLDLLREAAPDEARRWRVATREAFERLFAEGYLLVGLVHEAGRSFQLFERADAGTVLGRREVDAPRDGAGSAKEGT
ncbi:MAG: hypothetical protein PHV11_03035 [Candidatus Bipolaricaulis sp.]|nr:hypothetical protein [Candidatus Bipolaricaulis sp.]